MTETEKTFTLSLDNANNPLATRSTMRLSFPSKPEQKSSWELLEQMNGVVKEMPVATRQQRRSRLEAYVAYLEASVERCRRVRDEADSLRNRMQSQLNYKFDAEGDQYDDDSYQAECDFDEAMWALDRARQILSNWL